MTNIIVEAKSNVNSDLNEKKFVITAIDDIVFNSNKIVTKTNDFISFSKEKVYDLFLYNYGSIYSFVTKENNISGYIIVRKIKIDNIWTLDVAEITTGVSSPFSEVSEKNIYVSYLGYFEYDGINLKDATTGVEYNYKDIINYFTDNNFALSSGSFYYTDYEEEYEYYSKTDVSDVSFEDGYPLMSTLIGGSSYPNNCNPTAGLSIIMYWDRMYSDLIPSFNPIKTMLVGIPPYSYYYDYVYKTWSTLTIAEKNLLETYHNDLYTDMNTNNWYLYGLGPYDGTFPPDFYDAMESFFADNNYTLQHTNIVNGTNSWFGSGTELSSSQWSTYKDEIDNEHPVVISLGVDPSTNYSLYNGVLTLDYDGIPDLYTIYGTPFYYYLLTEEFTLYSNAAHMVIGYGYKEIDYYKINIYGNLYLDKTDKYFTVANGWGGTSYIKNVTSDISIAYSLYL